MAESTLPYVPAYGQLGKALDKIKTAQTPARFTQDFLATKLDMKGSTARPVIPFLKRTGFLGTDGVPTDLYKRFRNSTSSGAAAAEALRTGYPKLYEINEYVHEAKDAELRGLVVQVTGSEPDSQVVRQTVGSFKALRAEADFTKAADESPDSEIASTTTSAEPGTRTREFGELNLGYTINLHLPPTSDVAVFNAIFKSLLEHILAGS
jgi:hypothetical protein